MNDPDGDEPVTLERVFSPDRSRVAAWTVASCEVTADEKSLVYEVAVTETATGRQIARLTRRWTRDRHTGGESGSLLASVGFGASGTLLILHYEDGGREAVPLRETPDLDATGTVSLFAASAPCSICGSAGWTSEVCESCAVYCERLLASGGFQRAPCEVCRVLEEPCAACRRPALRAPSATSEPPRRR